MRKMFVAAIGVVALLLVSVAHFSGELAHRQLPTAAHEIGKKDLARTFVGTKCRVRKAAIPTVMDGHSIDTGYCSFTEGKELVFMTGVWHNPSGAMPVLSVTPSDKPIRRIVIYLVGGPGDVLLPELPMHPAYQLGFALGRAGNAAVYLGYYGTHYGSLFPQSDLFPAAEQVAEYVRMLKRKSNAPIVILGTSAGAPVGYLASRSFTDVPVLLLSPPIASMRQLQTRPLQPNGTRFVFNQRTRGDQLSAPPALVEATRGERMSAFFGETYSLSLSDLLMRYPRRSRNAPTVIVGDKDVRTGVEHLAAFRKAVPDVPVEVIEGMGHFPTDFEQAEQLATVIRRRINPECADRWWCTAWIGEQFF